MTKLSEKIIQEIEIKVMKPKPKWQFQLKESGRWLSVFGLVLLVALSVSMCWLFISELDLGLFGWLSGRPFLAGRGLVLIFLLLIIVAGALIFDIRKTKHGYKYKSVIILSAIAILGLFFAGLFAWSGLPDRLDRSLSGTPIYQSREQYMISVWQNPIEGRLAGEIIDIDQNNLSLRDFENKIWLVDATKAIWRHNLAPAVGLRIKLLGEGSGSVFTASDVRPFLPAMGRCGQVVEANGFGGCGMMR